MNMKTLYTLSLTLLLAACSGEKQTANAPTETVTPNAEQNQQAEKIAQQDEQEAAQSSSEAM